MRVVDVRAGSGAGWIQEAWLLFRAQPLAWISLLFTWLMVCLLLFSVPLIGPPVMLMLQPGFFAGFVLACRDQEMGKPVTIAYLVAAFKLSGRTLIQVGAIALLANMLVMLVLYDQGFFDGLRAIAPEAYSIEIIVDAFMDAIDKNSALWIAARVVFFIINGVLWFTSALIAHQPMSASHAIRWSFYALIGNFIPLLLFGAMISVLFYVATIPWLLGLPVVLPIYAITHYTSFKAVFRADVDIAVKTLADSPEQN